MELPGAPAAFPVPATASQVAKPAGSPWATGMLATSLLLALCCGPAAAQDMVCATKGYCTNALECHDDSEVFEIRSNPDGTTSYGWVGSAVFTAAPVASGELTAYFSTASGAVQTLVLGPRNSATFSISVPMGDALYSSFQVLRCQPR